MTDCYHLNGGHIVLNVVYDSIIALTNPVARTPFQLFISIRAWFISQILYRVQQRFSHLVR